jgi:hypothetical protein
MTSEVLQQTLIGGTIATFGRGRIFNLLQASSPVTITLEGKSVQGGQTAIRKFVNIPAGSKFTAKAGEEWTFLRVLSTAGQTITLFVGDDDMTFNNAVTVTGVAVVSVSPSGSVNSPAATPLAANTTDPTGVPANLARRRVTVYNLSTGAGGTIRVSDTGVTGRGFEIAAGTNQEIDTTAALFIRCDTATGATWGYLEET